MKYLNLTKSLATVAIFSLVFTACDKAKVATPMGDQGQTLVKILNGGTPASVTPKPIDFVNTPTKILAVEVRRDIPNETELNKTMIVTVKDDTAAVTALGRLHLPTAWYTISGSGVVKAGGQGGTFTLTFLPGEFSKSIYVTVPNATLLDPSLVYGLGFTVMTADQGAKLSTQKSTVVEIGAKNAYDGIYSYVSGLVTRYSAPGVPLGDLLSGPLGPLNPDLILATIGANTCKFENNGAPVGLTWSYLTMPISGVSGILGLNVTVDPATNLCVSTCTENLTFGNWFGKPNNYNPTTKTFTLSYKWNPATTVREYEMVIKYKGPR